MIYSKYRWFLVGFMIMLVPNMPYPIVVRPTSASQKPSSQQQRAHRLQVDNLEVQAREALTMGDR